MGNYGVVPPEVFAQVIIRMIERECGVEVNENKVVIVVDDYTLGSSSTYSLEEAIANKIREYGRQRERAAWLQMVDDCGKKSETLERLNL